MTKKKIVSISDLRAQKENKDNRKFKRVLFGNILGAFALIEQKGLLKVELVDISERGLRFKMPDYYGQFKKDENFAFRLYFSQEDYIPLEVKVVHKVVSDQEGPTEVQYGCSIQATDEVFQCLQHLVSFIQQYVAVSKQDHGDRQLHLR